MNFDKKHLPYVKRLGVRGVLDLCLLVPKGYNNTALIGALKDGAQGVVEVEITGSRMAHTRKSPLNLIARMPAFNERIDLVIFNAKPFHRALFAVGSRHFIQGKIALSGGMARMTQPKSVKNINAVTPIFRAGALSSAKMSELAQTYITRENLLAEGLDEESAALIAEIFSPTAEFAARFNAAKALPAEHLSAIKLAEIYNYLRRLSAKKINFPARHKCAGDYGALIDSLPFKLTDGQMGAIKDIAADLAGEVAARRLIMGDVGCGKTMVILAAAMMAYPNKSLLMAPTTILAAQLYAEAKKFLPESVGVELITAASKVGVKTKLAQDSTHFIIGTQALLHRNLELENLAVVMTDEQHRFGTQQRAALERMESGENSLENPLLRGAECVETYDEDSKINHASRAESPTGRHCETLRSEVVAINSAEQPNANHNADGIDEWIEQWLDPTALGSRNDDSMVIHASRAEAAQVRHCETSAPAKVVAINNAEQRRHTKDESDKWIATPLATPTARNDDSKDDSTHNATKSSASKTARPHVLQFSATPIPRTMAMINANFIQTSYIKDLPFKKDITTRVVGRRDFGAVLAHIKSEVKAGRQAIIVYPLVEQSDAMNYASIAEGEAFWRKHFERVLVTSGRDKDKESVLAEFRENGEVLLATTVVEVGISLPRLSTIVISAPERLGLATLHQLRGRVSRNGLKGYCFLFTHLSGAGENLAPNPSAMLVGENHGKNHGEILRGENHATIYNNIESTLKSTAQDSAPKRALTRLSEFCQTLNGFEIAELDLKYRSGGDLLGGERQSGMEFEFFDLLTDGAILLHAQELLKKAQNG